MTTKENFLKNSSWQYDKPMNIFQLKKIHAYEVDLCAIDRFDRYQKSALILNEINRAWEAQYSEKYELKFKAVADLIGMFSLFYDINFFEARKNKTWRI